MYQIFIGKELDLSMKLANRTAINAKLGPFLLVLTIL